MRRLKKKAKLILPKLFYRKLLVRIAVILVVMVTIPVVLLGILLINTSQKAIRNSVLSGHRQIITRAAEEIQLFVENPQDLLETTSSFLSVVYPSSWRQETILVELALNQPVFMRVYSIDLAGQEMASSELGRQVRPALPQEIIETVARVEKYSSGIKILDNHTPFITMAVPIKKLGKPVGALVADINLRGIWKIVDNITLGETGKAFLVSNDATLIAHQDKKKVLRNENLKGCKEVQAVLSGKTEAIELKDKAGNEWISAYAPVSGLGWGIVLRQSQDEAYSFSRIMKMQSWIIIALSELAAILVSIFMAKLFVRPIKDLVTSIKRVAGGDLDHIVKIKRRDEFGELTRSFNDMTKKLKRAKGRERLSAIGEASAWIAHEFKNSLVSIKSFIQLFPRKHKDAQFVEKFNQLMPKEISRWEYMLKELSEFSSRFDLTLSEVNLEEVISDALEMLKEECAQKGIEVKFAQGHANIYLAADPGGIKQVFLNIIINAISAMPEGGLLEISTHLSKEEDSLQSQCVEVLMQDNGKGVTSDAIKKIFEPFYTTKKGSMGLGLAISRRIIEQHRGHIEVKSEVNAGTIFKIKLPLKRS